MSLRPKASRSPRVAWVALACVAPAWVACKHSSSGDAPGDARGDAPPVSLTDGVTEGGKVIELAGSSADGGTGPVLRIAAIDQTTPICSRPEWPARDPTKATDERIGVIRLGYLRKGDVVDAKLQVLQKPSCTEGWYELVTGGFVCGKSVTRDLDSKELAEAPHPPLTDGPLPYQYALNLTTGTPLYRRKVTREERKQYERGLPVGKTEPKAPGEGPSGGGGSGGGDTPWYLKEGARKSVSLNDLQKSEGPVVQRMVRGFYLSLDKQVSGYSGHFWRTAAGYYAPAEHVKVHDSKTEFEGVHVGDADEKRKLPVGFITGLHARQYRFAEGTDKPKRGEHVDRFTVLGLTGQKKVFEDRNYYETLDGWYTRDLDGTTTKPGPAPTDLTPGEKWIDVNLSTQSLVAFEGDKPVYATFISSGRHNDTDPGKDHRTKMGTFRIREKHISATMDDDSASDGPYSIEDVPWIMYFNGSYALHGAFWHSAFGHERSHGCVNMTPHDAKEIFGWAGPKLPTGWHGVRATAENAGTRVIVHD